MKIGIVTVYYSENCGSLLQAISLEKKLRELGNEVVFINTRHKGSSHSLRLLLGRIVKESLKLNFYNVKNAIGKYYNFKKDIKRFKVINFNDIEKEKLDLIIIGSDTVWDIERDYFYKQSNIFFPNSKTIPVVSYAASIGNTQIESFKKAKNVLNALNNFNKITVRDEYSKNVLSHLLKTEIDIVVDPTIMIGKNAFDEFLYDIKESKYLLVYSFDDFDQKTVNEIKQFAESKNLKIISIGKKFYWSDKNITNSLQAFISYYNSAEYVITNTFHGNVFSIIFNKQFVNIDFGKKKVDKLLEQYDLSSRIYKKNVNSIIDIFNNTIDYNIVNNIMEKDRNKANSIIKKFTDKNNKDIYK